ncbi:acetylserotonin O-methyltransferase-like [Tubulanus polymorphus]|uniref:acetylserotonin O-methyltransferase-like n=1 Tax=Tubulanus polymorphus TaxID=672921 RepID=UPI003DA3D89C
MDLTRLCMRMLSRVSRTHAIKCFRRHQHVSLPQHAKAVPPKIYDLITAHRNSQVLMAACDLKIFDELEKNRGRPMTAEDVAKRLDLDPDATEKLLNVLAGMELLKKHWDIVGTGLFANTQESRQCFLTKNKQNVTNYVMEELNTGVPAFNMIKETLQSGGRLKQPDENDEETHGFIQSNNSPELEFPITEAKNALAEALAPNLVSAFELEKHNTCIIIGDCSSIAVEMCHTYPHMNTTFFAINEAASEYSLENKIPDNLVIQSIDVMNDSIPSCDLLVLSHVIRELDEENTRNVLTKCASALKEGGTLQILEKMINDKKDGPLLTLTTDLLLFMLKGSHSYSFDDFRKLLKPHGFSNVQCKIMVDDPFYDILIAEKKH